PSPRSRDRPPRPARPGAGARGPPRRSPAARPAGARRRASPPGRPAQRARDRPRRAWPPGRDPASRSGTAVLGGFHPALEEAALPEQIVVGNALYDGVLEEE